MPELLTVSYDHTGASVQGDGLGMREMQARAYAKRDARYLLIKAPPASGKSRALMFIALDKVHRQGRSKVIVAVPEMTIGSSFKDTDLRSGGFFADWRVEPRYNLCVPGQDEGKKETFIAFLKDANAHYLICTHATLRFAWEKIHDLQAMHLFDTAVVAIDEFHHTSAHEGSRLGEVVDDLMSNTDVHLIAMTGSYFRGDRMPILTPEREAQFEQVVYTYYEQLNGYRYLKSLGLGYHFYTGSYLDAIREVLDLGKKTIIHIPNVNSRESTKRKYDEVGAILTVIGTVEQEDENTIFSVRTEDGRLLKVADLVTDNERRPAVLQYLRNVKKAEDIDIIIALGMAKEGFDWPWCEHVLTVGYRSSLTEVVQIIGRATRDCEGKTHAQFTNLIAAPDALQDDVQNAVNDLLKAISLSLLMHDVLAPNIMFRPLSSVTPDTKVGDYDVIVDDSKVPMSRKVQELTDKGAINALLTDLHNDHDALIEGMLNDDIQMVWNVVLPNIIAKKYPDLEPEERETLAYLVKATVALICRGNRKKTPPPGETPGVGEERTGSSGGSIPAIGITPEEGDDDERRISPNDDFVSFGAKILDVDRLAIDLIDTVNPFLGAYEILSKTLDAPTLKTIQDLTVKTLSSMTEEEAVALWGRILAFREENGKAPSAQSLNAYERRLGEALAFIRNAKAQRMLKTQPGGKG